MIQSLAILGFKSGCYGYGAHMAVALALIALAMGFLVCVKADPEKTCKKWGKVVGTVISVIALLLIICLAVLCFKSFMQDGCKSKRGGRLPSGHPPLEAPVNQ